MNTDQLRLFLAIVRHRSLTRAALELDLGQATVSERLKALETELGAQLFERKGRGVALSAAGNAFRPYAERALEVLREAQDVVHTADARHGGQVCVAVTVTSGAYLFAPALAAFQRDYPNVVVQVRSAHSWDAPGLIFDGLAQLALVSGPVIHPQIETIASFHSPLVLVAGKKHLRIKHPFTLADLGQQQLLVSYWGPSSQAFLERVRLGGERQAGLWLELSPVELVKGMLLAGNGISLLPEIAVRKELAAGDLIRLKLTDTTMKLPTWEVTLIRHSRAGQAKAAEALTETLLNILPGLVR